MDNPLIPVMTTQTWAYYHAQPIDICGSRCIKMHAIKNHDVSYCGLHNGDVVGGISARAFTDAPDSCEKCAKAVYRRYFGDGK